MNWGNFVSWCRSRTLGQLSGSLVMAHWNRQLAVEYMFHHELSEIVRSIYIYMYVSMWVWVSPFWIKKTPPYSHRSLRVSIVCFASRAGKPQRSATRSYINIFRTDVGARLAAYMSLPALRNITPTST